MIALVWAMGRNRVIGKGGKMPWHMPADLYRFRKLTKGHTVVMGRKTYESIGAPLEDRKNIVVTRDQAYQAPGCEVIHSAVELLGHSRDLFIIGGADLYQQFLPHADLLYVTRIEAEFEGDTLFPEFDWSKWRRTTVRERPSDDRNPYDCIFETYERVGPKEGT
jgi:dihydrofolate reductase